ncbi:MAG: TIGR04149 family rSAM-modified RiPP, partial [Dysgonamonadaceae bacterium]|nr:TIGR04149 family rSAM-modified RiPP [Dysgonamonadaceae bacterium]
MKRLKKLKLNNLEQGFLNDREMNILRGGGTPGNCNCCCGYENNGGSSSSANSSANNA